MPHASHRLLRARVHAPCPSCFRRVHLLGSRHAIFADFVTMVSSTMPVACPHCDAILELRGGSLLPLSRAVPLFTPGTLRRGLRNHEFSAGAR